MPSNCKKWWGFSPTSPTDCAALAKTIHKVDNSIA